MQSAPPQRGSRPAPTGPGSTRPEPALPAARAPRPVVEGVLLAEVAEVLLLLLGHGAEHLAAAPVPAFAHSGNVKLATNKQTKHKTQGSQWQVVAVARGHAGFTAEAGAVKQSCFTPREYDRRYTLWSLYCPLPERL